MVDTKLNQSVKNYSTLYQRVNNVTFNDWYKTQSCGTKLFHRYTFASTEYHSESSIILYQVSFCQNVTEFWLERSWPYAWTFLAVFECFMTVSKGFKIVLNQKRPWNAQKPKTFMKTVSNAGRLVTFMFYMINCPKRCHNHVHVTKLKESLYKIETVQKRGLMIYQKFPKLKCRFLSPKDS